MVLWTANRLDMAHNSYVAPTLRSLNTVPNLERWPMLNQCIMTIDEGEQCAGDPPLRWVFSMVSWLWLEEPKEKVPVPRQAADNTSTDSIRILTRIHTEMSHGRCYGFLMFNHGWFNWDMIVFRRWSQWYKLIDISIIAAWGCMRLYEVVDCITAKYLHQWLSKHVNILLHRLHHHPP